MRIRSFISTELIAIGIVGVSIFGLALLTIKESTVASTGSDYIPVLAAIDTSAENRSVVYPVKPKRGDYIGELVIARLEKSIPIYEGTEVDQLQKGSGHYEKSVLPGMHDNSVIAGHRDSVFAEFGRLQISDALIVQTSYGQFEYRIKGFRVVNADDRTVIVPTEIATLTLSTCYPFNFLGNAPQRFIVSAELMTSS
jgi:sortase A